MLGLGECNKKCFTSAPPNFSIGEPPPFVLEDRSMAKQGQRERERARAREREREKGRSRRTMRNGKELHIQLYAPTHDPVLSVSSSSSELALSHTSVDMHSVQAFPNPSFPTQVPPIKKIVQTFVEQKIQTFFLFFSADRPLTERHKPIKQSSRTAVVATLMLSIPFSTLRVSRYSYTVKRREG